MKGCGKKTSWKVFKENANLLDDLGHGILTEDTVHKAEELICKLHKGTKETSINVL